MDFSGEMIKRAGERYPDLEFREADIESLKPWGETFDVLILADVVGHLQDIEETRISSLWFRKDGERAMQCEAGFTLQKGTS